MKKLETSKIIAYAIISLFSFCAIFIVIASIFLKTSIDNLEEAIEVLKIISTPVTIILTGYYGKAAIENWKKIGLYSTDNSDYTNKENDESTYQSVNI